VLFWPEPVGGGSGLPGADKVVHVGLFALLAATARLRFGGDRRVLVALGAYAVVSELVQAALLTTRSGDGWDVLADLIGVAAGWWLTEGALRRRSRAAKGGRIKQ